MKRIGILGGSFNPIHIGHLAIAQYAKEAMSLDKVVFVPSNWPPHKQPEVLIAASYRYHMVQIAIADNKDFAISDFEIRKEGKSYTYETMRFFRDKYPKTKLFFIMGGDLLPQLKSWRYIDEILKIGDFIAVNRPGESRRIKGIPYHAVAMPGIDISSSYIRTQIAKGKSIRYFVPNKVIAYIEKKGLYKSLKKRKRGG